MTGANVILVMLRQKTHRDPFWEFGSFGCTGCHRKNLMHPENINEINGMRFGFAQGGKDGIKLVHVTPPVTMSNHNHVCEATWMPSDWPLTYNSAPMLVSKDGLSDVPNLLNIINSARCNTPMQKFASKFRTRKKLYLPT